MSILSSCGVLVGDGPLVGGGADVGVVPGRGVALGVGVLVGTAPLLEVGVVPGCGVAPSVDVGVSAFVSLAVGVGVTIRLIIVGVGLGLSGCSVGWLGNDGGVGLPTGLENASGVAEMMVSLISGGESPCATRLPSGVNVAWVIGLGDTIRLEARYQMSCGKAVSPQPTGPIQCCQRPATVIMRFSGSNGRNCSSNPPTNANNVSEARPHVAGDG